MKKLYDLPDVVDKDPSEIKSIIEQITACSLPDDVKKFVAAQFFFKLRIITVDAVGINGDV